MLAGTFAWRGDGAGRAAYRPVVAALMLRSHRMRSADRWPAARGSTCGSQSRHHRPAARVVRRGRRPRGGVAFEDHPQYNGAARQVNWSSAQTVSCRHGGRCGVSRSAAVSGVREVIAYPILKSACDRSLGPHSFLTAMIATCDELAVIDRQLPDAETAR